ncbi:hypothetical protein HYFRA_00000936 [Hymenoscyphus fraxineus]|uniref:Uncharacterized protein n=1 Tax=Hymenoscyphus fraxineus TaxID=746836 RepID=A0A9N9KRJ7_9HELO|nr:hypothetical protein HYFRA_00000936 [Hymenoscyphus fraxineus]
MPHGSWRETKRDMLQAYAVITDAFCCSAVRSSSDLPGMGSGKHREIFWRGVVEVLQLPLFQLVPQKRWTHGEKVEIVGIMTRRGFDWADQQYQLLPAVQHIQFLTTSPDSTIDSFISPKPSTKSSSHPKFEIVVLPPLLVSIPTIEKRLTFPSKTPLFPVYSSARKRNLNLNLALHLQLSRTSTPSAATIRRPPAFLHILTSPLSCQSFLLHLWFLTLPAP